MEHPGGKLKVSTCAYDHFIGGETETEMKRLSQDHTISQCWGQKQLSEVLTPSLVPHGLGNVASFKTVIQIIIIRNRKSENKAGH